MKTILFSLLFIGNIIYSQAQSTIYGVEWDSTLNVSYFVHLNPNNGSFTRIDSLTGVADAYTAKGTAISDESSNYYTFATYLNSSLSVANLYNINKNTGAIVSNPTLSTPVMELNYDNISGNYYAIEFEDTTITPAGGLSMGNDNGDTTIINAGATVISGIYHTVSVNTSTGAVSRIANLSGVTSISLNNSAYNNSKSEFVFVSGQDSIYTVDITDGSILYSSLLTTSIKELHYNNTSGVYYAIENDNNTYYLVSVDHTTGLATRINSINGLNNIQISSSTLDEINNIYSIVDENDVIYNINTSNGNVLSSSQINSNIIGLTINVTVPAPAINYQLTNEPELIVQDTTIKSNFNKGNFQTAEEELVKEVLAYPNPATSQLTIELNTFPSTLNIYNTNGHLIKSKNLNQKTTIVNVEDLDNGLYYFNIYNGKNLDSKKILIQ